RCRPFCGGSATASPSTLPAKPLPNALEGRTTDRSFVEKETGMPKARIASLRFVLGGCMLLGVVAPMTAAPTAGKMLEYQPRQDASTSPPTAAEQASCKVDSEKTPNGSAWVLKDPAGRYLRRFYAPNQKNGEPGRVDTWSYYKDGQEVYREID